MAVVQEQKHRIESYEDKINSQNDMMRRVDMQVDYFQA